ncbi:Uncharacterized protein BP5553_05084 [Venustampulla echinocandica]|uniref:Azaphilone pigments biosynthesis cluster protein L N-terminal domain-containing protein n=1 Tax=Venustampulla echinocandica TaxID=2656787 RepID=A0A370TQ50_9HELO|nr:Uncharacterized protein BP5553_05084 [Venustampulla echinocandica]RDL37651.1 Uncharacterized protein BP5553_05084 [Venustampulla echinocandica]
MADPLSITASAVGIIVPALHGTRLLLEDLQQLKDAPKTVKRLVEDVESVSSALKLLQSVNDRDWDLLGASIAEHFESTISSCTRACNIFRADLQRWTRHSNNRKLAWQDQANVGFLKKGQIKAMSDQLANCKLTINSVGYITEDIMKMISTKQTEVKGAITTTDRQVVVLENKLEELNLSSDDDEATGSREGKTEELRQLEEELKGVKASQKLLNELLSKSQEEAVARAAGNQSGSITVTFSAQNSGFQVGNINGGISGLTFGGK